MQIAIIKASDVFGAGRMDAGYHIAAQRVAARVDVLKGQKTAEDILEQLGQLDLDALQVLKPLHRGQAPMNHAAAMRAAAEYPHIAMALVEESLADVIAQREKDAAKAQTQTALLKSILAGSAADPHGEPSKNS